MTANTNQRAALVLAQSALDEAARLVDDAAREFAKAASQASKVHPGFQWGDSDLRPVGELRVDLMAATKYAQLAADAALQLHGWADGLQHGLNLGPERDRTGADKPNG